MVNGTYKIFTAGERMERGELEAVLRSLEIGKMAGIHHDVYADLFPPGEPDVRAREACLQFARTCGCRVDNRVTEQTVWFVKDA